MKNFNKNWIAVGILVSLYVISVFRFGVISTRLESASPGDTEGPKLIRVAHWQLEPGFREALQAVIDEYNALPRVKAARVEIVQADIPEKVFNQFMNIHLISGTAPDIAVKANTALIQGNSLARFYTPLGAYINEPNPYNAPAYQAEGLDPAFAGDLASTPWRDTFQDGLASSYDGLLGDYYSIPISTWGGLRIFYNVDLLAEVKAFALAEAGKKSPPGWLTLLWRTETHPDGYLPEADARAWLSEARTLPRTLGQLMLYANAVNAYAESTGDTTLVPVAGSNYNPNLLAEIYERGFFFKIAESLDVDAGSGLSPMEVLEGFAQGRWSFQSPAIRQYFSFLNDFQKFYPHGFLGLDREQAQRRFVLGQAAMISSGGWDAAGIFDGVHKRSRPEDRFEIKLTPPPLPGDDERWHDFIVMRASEAASRGAVPFAINKQSPFFDWALDFLKFITSHRINEQFSHQSGWLPVVNGAKPPEKIAAFMPLMDGFPAGYSMTLGGGDIPIKIRSAWTSSIKLLYTGQVSADEVSSRIVDVMNDPNLGIRRAWITELQSLRDRSRADMRTISVERLKAVLNHDEKARQRERSTLYRALQEDEGILLRRLWQHFHPEDPYPSR